MVKEIELILCFADHTWAEYRALISYGQWVRRDKAEIETHFEQVEPLSSCGINHPGGAIEKPIIALMVSWWGPEE